MQTQDLPDKSSPFSSSPIVTGAPDHTVVVAAASRHGSTRAIARRLASVLSADLSGRWSVQQSDLSDLRALEGVDAVVLGSAVYFGHWMRPAVRALHQVKDDPLLDLWLFSTGPVSVDLEENDQLATADRAVESGCATEHVVFGGNLDATTLHWWERRIVSAVHAVGVDRRNWRAVDDWAHSIARQLSHAIVSSDPAQ